MHLKNGTQVLEVRLARDGQSLVNFTVQDFYDQVMRDKAQVQINKFYRGVTNTWQADSLEDPNFKRRGKLYSISRDTLNGPRRAGQYGFPAFDPDRFRDEADKLISRGYIKRYVGRQVDWNEDESIMDFFLHVQDALANATHPNTARDIASAGPSIFLFTELMKRTEKIVEEELTEMWARRIFPIRMLNTWLPIWMYTREAQQSSALPQYVNYDEVPSNIPRHSERRVPVTPRLVYFDEGASWTQHELWVMAEAVANGAASYQFDVKRTNAAKRNLLYKENLLAFFGDTEVVIKGALSGQAITGIQEIPATVQFGSGDAEQDRSLLVNTAMYISSNSDEVLKPNFIGLSNTAFYHCISQRYGNESNSSDQTVAGACLQTLKDIGITTLTRIPELGPRAAEETKLISRGVNATMAERLSGGLNVIVEDEPTQVDAIMFAKMDSEVWELVVAKDITMYPAAETMRGKTEIRMVMGSGGMEVYQPEGVKYVTNVSGPDTLPIPNIATPP
jgi:hypothetical protein